jgi:hypothetical protein
MEGRTGNLLVQPGNVVKANEDAPLVVIAQVHPIYVSFSVPEGNLGAIKRYRAEGTLKVEAITADKPQRPAVGALTFMNNTVDPTTGTIQLKATFPNTDNALWPGQAVDVVLTSSETAGRAREAVRQAGAVRLRGGCGEAYSGRRLAELVIEQTGGGARGDRRPAPAGARGPRGDQAAEGVVSTALFIRRPVLTTLMMAAIMLFGLMAYQLLPVSDLPNVDFPTIRSTPRCRAPAPRPWPPRWPRRSSASSRPSPASIR